ncbi:MAG: hypothetical protein LBI48_00025 [Burkholderiaceae bacterium]|jgi:hypothetical protein|nr:hypothetical protein [Burkholderiaceae bacterium]
MQQIIVALIVLAALARVVWPFIPAHWRRRLTAPLGLRDSAAICHDCARCSDCTVHGMKISSKNSL